MSPTAAGTAGAGAVVIAGNVIPTVVVPAPAVRVQSAPDALPQPVHCPGVNPVPGVACRWTEVPTASALLQVLAQLNAPETDPVPCSTTSSTPVGVRPGPVGPAPGAARDGRW